MDNKLSALYSITGQKVNYCLEYIIQSTAHENYHDEKGKGLKHSLRHYSSVCLAKQFFDVMWMCFRKIARDHKGSPVLLSVCHDERHDLSLVSRRFVRMDVLSGRRFVRTALDVLSGRRFVRTALDVLSGRTCLRRFVRKTFCQDQLRRFVRKTFCQDRFVWHFFQADRLRRFVRKTFCQDRLTGGDILVIS